MTTRAFPVWDLPTRIFQWALETVGAVLNGTATYHHARAAYAEAEPLLQRALKIWEKVLGPEHPNVTRGLRNYAALLRKRDRAEAEKMEARATAIQSAH